LSYLLHAKVDIVKPYDKNKPIAYFCAEFGIDNSLPIYAGGLGILAGDLLKAAADENFPMIGVGLLYQGKFSIQKIKEDGWQEELDNNYRLEDCGLEPVLDGGNTLFVVANFAGQDVWINAYKKMLASNTYLLLLTTNNQYNTDVWKGAMVANYCCDDENQLRQQMILGIGGIKMLQALHINPKIIHLNEGRPIFLNWQLIHQIMNTKRTSFEKARKKAKSMTVYTNHTLLKAGNLTYPALAVKKYAAGYVNALDKKTDLLVEPGIEKDTGKFSISKFALNVSSKASAVSQIHGKLSKKEWPGFNWFSITNGVHLPSWQDSSFANPNISSDEIWENHLRKKRELREEVQKRTGFGYDENNLIISWARRIADYKRLTSIFKDIGKLKSILSHSSKPVQLLVAGKGHYGDDAAKKIVQEVIKIMQNELSGHTLYIPNYNIKLAKYLVSGSDVWLNTPEFGLEASGTSGMKALSNGVLNCTVADGWANEVDWKNTGWMLDSDNISNDLYDKLSKKIIPLYYKRNKKGIPEGWIKKMAASIKLSQQYSAKRMLNEYKENLYS